MKQLQGIWNWGLPQAVDKTILSTEEPNPGNKKGQRLCQQALIVHCPKNLMG